MKGLPAGEKQEAGFSRWRTPRCLAKSAEIIDWEEDGQTLFLKEWGKRAVARLNRDPRDYVAEQGRNEDQSMFCWNCSSGG
jgi:hypothetical protein